MKRNSIWWVVGLGSLILLGTAADTRAAETPEIGIVHFECAGLGGKILTSGDVVLDRGLVRTELEQAIVHLSNGQVLKLEGNSAARFEAGSFDEIHVTVLSGRLIKWSAKGKPLTAGAGSRFTIGRSTQDPLVTERALLGVASLDESRARSRDRGTGRR